LQGEDGEEFNEVAEILLQLQDNLTVNPRSRRYTTRTVTGAADSLAESCSVVGSSFSRRTRRLDWLLGLLINIAASAAALHVTGNTLAASLVTKAAIAQAPGRRTASTSDSLTDKCGHGNVGSSNKTPAGSNDYDGSLGQVTGAPIFECDLRQIIWQQANLGSVADEQH